MNALDFMLERTVLICAPRATVFRYFMDSDRWASWWGPGSRIEPRPGGEVHIRYPGDVIASGRVEEIEAPRRIVFTYGYEGQEPKIPPGGSRVTITLEENARGTLVRLLHQVLTAEVRDEHVQGWRYQLAVFANVVAREAHAGASDAVDRFLAAWNEKDAARRAAELAAIATDDLSFRDAFSCTRGTDDLVAHMGAAQIHMPGLMLERAGEVRQCQGAAIADWVAKGPDGNPRGRGTDVFELSPEGRITGVVGFWSKG